jgi:hypothetical protein
MPNAGLPQELELMSLLNCPHCHVAMTASERSAGSCGSCGTALPTADSDRPSEANAPEPNRRPPATLGAALRTLLQVFIVGLALIGVIAKGYRVIFEDRTIRLPDDYMERMAKTPLWVKDALAQREKTMARLAPQQAFASQFLDRLRQGDAARAYDMLDWAHQDRMLLSAFEKSIEASPWIKTPGKGSVFVDVKLDSGETVGWLLENGKAGKATIGVATLPGGRLSISKFDLQNE